MLMDYSLLTATTPQSLIERRITHIVSVCNEAIPADNRASGYITHRIPVEDNTVSDILIHLPAACNFIYNAINSGGIVLVHCVQGLSRSACVVAAYRMIFHSLILLILTIANSDVVSSSFCHGCFECRASR